MRVLLLNPLYQQPVGEKYERYFVRSGSRWPHSGVKLKGTTPHYLPFPFSLAYAATCLKEASFDVRAIDAVALNISEEKLLREIESIDPQLIFYEVTTPTINYDLRLAKKIKELVDVKIVLGGGHAAYFASEIIQEHGSIDFIIRGDYEYTLSDLARKLERGLPVETPGVVYLASGRKVDNGDPFEQERSRNLLSPFRDIFPSNKLGDPTLYWDGFCQHRKALQIQSSRGCRYGCTFCLSSRFSAVKSKTYCVASAQQICDEVEAAVAKYDVEEIYFDDDNFTQNMQHLDGIFESLRVRKLIIPWSAMASFSGLTEEIIQRLAGYGCIGLKLGIESASSQVLRNMHKSVDLRSVAGIINRCRQCGIKTHLTFSLGFIDETLENTRETILYAQSLDADSIQVSIATPLPGTEFFERAKAEGYLVGLPWESYDAKRSSVIYPFCFYDKNLGKLRKDFLRRWFMRKVFSPFWILRHLPIIFRTLKGLGCILFFKQLTAILIDESKNS